MILWDFLKKGKIFKKSLTLVLSTKIRHTCEFSLKNSKNWIFPGQKTSMNKKSKCIIFNYILLKKIHEASKLSSCSIWIHFRASWSVFLVKCENFYLFWFLCVKVFWPGKIQFLEFFHEILQVCLLFVDKTKFKLFWKFFLFLKKSKKIMFLGYELYGSGKIQFSEFVRFL